MPNAQPWTLPADLDDAVRATLRAWTAEGKVERLWARDATLWTGGSEASWLGWLDIIDAQLAEANAAVPAVDLHPGAPPDDYVKDREGDWDAKPRLDHIAQERILRVVVLLRVPAKPEVAGHEIGQGLQSLARRTCFGHERAQPPSPGIKLAMQFRDRRLWLETPRQEPPGRFNVPVLREKMRAKQHFLLGFVCLDPLQHITHVRGDRSIVEREQVAQGGDIVDPTLHQLFLQQSDRVWVVIAQQPDERVLLRHAWLYDFCAARASLPRR